MLILERKDMRHLRLLDIVDCRAQEDLHFVYLRILPVGCIIISQSRLEMKLETRKTGPSRKVQGWDKISNESGDRELEVNLTPADTLIAFQSLQNCGLFPKGRGLQNLKMKFSVFWIGLAQKPQHLAAPRPATDCILMRLNAAWASLWVPRCHLKTLKSPTYQWWHDWEVSLILVSHGQSRRFDSKSCAMHIQGSTMTWEYFQYCKALHNYKINTTQYSKCMQMSQMSV